jgi:hypothetical protein
MQNPWLLLPDQSPHVLPQDHAVIEQFNAGLPPGSRCRIHVEGVIPEPFVGAVTTAQVIVLLLNPGSDETNVGSHADPEFRKALLANLRHSKTDWPFYFLDPRFKVKHPGVKWWRSKTRQLGESVGWDKVAHRLAVIEWFPYKSPRYGRNCKVPSQQYGFTLVENAMNRRATIIIARSVKRWLASVPRLEVYDKMLALHSVQNVSLTKNNLRCASDPNADAWELVLDSLS